MTTMSITPIDSKDEEKQGDVLYQVSSIKEQVLDDGTPATRDLWGDLDDDGPRYRNLGWIRATVLMTKYQVGLGVLGIPYILHTFGIAPGCLLLTVVAAAATWADYVVGVVKVAYPEVYSIPDICTLMWGPRVGDICGFLFWISGAAVASSSILGISISFNVLSDHALCTVAWVVIASVIVVSIASIQTLDRISWIGWIGVVGIMSSVITLTVAVGVQDRPAAAPTDGPFESGFRVTASPSFFDGVAALGAAVFSFAGAPNFLNIVAEMRNPRDYPRALAICQIFTVVTYLIIGSIVYYFCGAYVASPALGSAGPVMKKVCYGLALPGLIVSAVLCTHFPGKFLFVRLMRNSEHFARNTIPHRLAWGGCVIGSAIIAFIIAEAVPVFSDLLSILGSLISIPLAIGIESWIYIWLCCKQKRRLTSWTYAVYGINMFIILASAVVAVSGLVGACISVRNHVKNGQTSAPFSCGDNSV